MRDTGRRTRAPEWRPEEGSRGDSEHRGPWARISPAEKNLSVPKSGHQTPQIHKHHHIPRRSTPGTGCFFSATLMFLSSLLVFGVVSSEERVCKQTPTRAGRIWPRRPEGCPEGAFSPTEGQWSVWGPRMTLVQSSCCS